MPKTEHPISYIAFLGDYGLTKRQYDAMDGQSRHDLNTMLAYLGRKGDIIVNFEFLPPTSDIFSIDFLRDNHVTGAIVSNNHACDGGAPALQDSARQLSQKRVEPFGTLDMPSLSLTRNGSKYAVYALTEALDISCNGVNTAKARDHRSEIRSLARSRTVIVYAHDPGPSFYVTDYEEKTARRYLDMGASVVVIDGSHNMKGARRYGSAIGLFGLGNFLLTYRDPDDYLSVAAIVGFDGGKPVYLGIIPFYDKRGAVFRLLHGKQLEAATSLYRERGLPAGGRAYSDTSTIKLVRSSGRQPAARQEHRADQVEAHLNLLEASSTTTTSGPVAYSRPFSPSLWSRAEGSSERRFEDVAPPHRQKFTCNLFRATR